MLSQIKKDIDVFRKVVGKLEEENRELVNRLAQQQRDYEKQLDILKAYNSKFCFI
jgi:hypothetical protein